MQKLTCPNCATDIPAENINIAQTLAVCPNCDTVFDFSFMGDAKDKPKTKATRKLHPPKGFHIEENATGFTMSWRWFQPVAIFLTFFVIAWDGFLIFWYRMALGGFGSSFSGGANLIMILFPIAHVAIGVGMTYYVLALYLNRTAMTVSDAEIKVRTFPLPYPWKDRTLAASDVEQVYVKQSISHNKNGTSISYDVRAQLYGAPDEKLVTGLHTPEFALYIEQEVEAYLGIENREVYGEYSG